MYIEIKLYMHRLRIRFRRIHSLCELYTCVNDIDLTSVSTIVRLGVVLFLQWCISSLSSYYVPLCTKAMCMKIECYSKFWREYTPIPKANTGRYWVNEFSYCCLTPIQLYHGKNKLIFQWDHDDEVCLVLVQHA